MHEVFEVVPIVGKPAAEVIRKIGSNNQSAPGRAAECHQPGFRVDGVSVGVLNDSIKVDHADDIRSGDRLDKAAAGKRRTHCTLELKGSGARIADADPLPDQLAIAWIFE